MEETTHQARNLAEDVRAIKRSCEKYDDRNDGVDDVNHYRSKPTILKISTDRRELTFYVLSLLWMAKQKITLSICLLYIPLDIWDVQKADVYQILYEFCVRDNQSGCPKLTYFAVSNSHLFCFQRRAQYLATITKRYIHIKKKSSQSFARFSFFLSIRKKTKLK